MVDRPEVLRLLRSVLHRSELYHIGHGTSIDSTDEFRTLSFDSEISKRFASLLFSPKEREFLNLTNFIFTIIFAVEMTMKIIAAGFICGPHTYLHNGWNVMDGSLVIISIVDLATMNRGHGPVPAAGAESDATTRIFSMLRVFRLLRTLRPLRGKTTRFDRRIEFIAVFAVLLSDQSCTGSETGRSNAAVLTEADRSHRGDLLYLFHHLRHFGRSSNPIWKSAQTSHPVLSVVQREILLL